MGVAYDVAAFETATAVYVLHIAVKRNPIEADSLSTFSKLSRR